MSEAYVVIRGSDTENPSIDIVSSQKPEATNYEQIKSGRFVRKKWVDEPVSKDDRVYTVIVIYRTGSSFGDDRLCTAIACVCTDEKSALLARRMIEKTDGRCTDKTIPRWDTGIFGYSSWIGHFERLISVEIHRAIVWE